ncbi:MAG: SusF/SusE family outer membrane protein [Bacteroidales bacterium]|nr:SusF/SusE family outer membrane protein [Bacteroidales bacterium]MCF8456401.1 SusF/SusE family outer membrane protein [Bacteroidales bacterium]
MKTTRHWLYLFFIALVIISCKKDNDPAPLDVQYTKADALCNNANTGMINLTVTGAVSPYSFIWSNGATSEDIDSLQAGSYSVTITDNKAEYLSETILIEEGTEIIIEDSIANNTLYIKVSGGTSPYTFLWHDGTTMSSLPYENQGAWSVTVTDANNCSNTKEVTVQYTDGLYIVGLATPTTDPLLVKMANTRNEVTQEIRPQLFEKYITLQAGLGGFNILRVNGGTYTYYGPGPDFDVVNNPTIDEPQVTYSRGSFIETSTVFLVPENGLYHIALDLEVEKIVIVPVEYWGLIGGATPNGWSDDTKMLPGTFSPNSMTFSVENVEMINNEFKFRYSGAWKVILDPDFDLGFGNQGIKVNCNLGGSIDNLIPGGANFANTVPGIYSATMNWSLESGYSATMTKTGNIITSPYPEELYMIGATVGGWDWATIDLPMVAVHSHPELFWKIVWMEAGIANEGIKFAPGREWIDDFGVYGDPTNGVWAKGSDNVPGPATSGYYMVVVDFDNATIEINQPTVYLIGDCVGSWDALDPDALLTVDNGNEVITITKNLAAGNLRMYAAATTLAADWWQAEFNIYNNMIEFRGTGGDMAAVPVTAGNHTINLNFINHVGTISTN